jgi:hypothetical protein
MGELLNVYGAKRRRRNVSLGASPQERDYRANMRQNRDSSGLSAWK